MLKVRVCLLRHAEAFKLKPIMLDISLLLMLKKNLRDLYIYLKAWDCFYICISIRGFD